MMCSRLNLLLICLSWLAIFIKFNESRPAPYEIVAMAEIPNAAGVYLYLTADFENTFKKLSSDDKKTVCNRIKQNLPLGLVGCIIAEPANISENPETISESLPIDDLGSSFQKLPAGIAGSLIAAVPSGELGPQIKSLPSGELARVLRAIPHPGVQKVLSSVPSSNLRAVLGQLPNSELEKILQSESSLGSVPDDKLPEVAARLGSGLIYLAKFFPASKDGHLLAHLPTSDAGNFVKGLSPGNVVKFANLIPKDKLTAAIGTDNLKGDADETSEENNNSKGDADETSEENRNSSEADKTSEGNFISKNRRGGLIENILNGLIGSGGLLG